MLEFCVKQNVFLYAMIAAGIAGVWCLFWNNRFYTRAIRDLGRLKEPKSKWTRSVLETCQRKAHPFSNAGAFMRSQIAQGRSAGMAVPTLLRGSQNMILTVLALSILSLWAIYRYRYGEAELMRYLGTGIALAGGLVFFRLCLDFGGKEEILLNGWTDYLENEFAATKQSAVLETVQQTERQPVQAETMAQAGTGAAKAKPQTAGSESAKERNELFADPEKKRGFRSQGGHPPDRRGREQVCRNADARGREADEGDYQRIRVNTRGSGRGAWHIDMTIFPNRQSAGI